MCCNLPPTYSHLHLLQVENCDSNSRLVVDEDDNGKFRFEKVNPQEAILSSAFIDQQGIERRVCAGATLSYTAQ